MKFFSLNLVDWLTPPRMMSQAVAGSRAVIFAAGSRRKSTSVLDGINSDLPTIEGDTPDNVDNGDLAPILWQHFRCMWLAHAVEK
jgi:hypothetical protein